jgi:hypothetical protein
MVPEQCVIAGGAGGAAIKLPALKQATLECKHFIESVRKRMLSNKLVTACTLQSHRKPKNVL